MIRVGILDSGIGGDAAARVVAHTSFPAIEDAARDRLGHGSAIANIILERVPHCELLDARVFRAALRCSANAAAEGIDWLVGAGAQLINLSLGLRADRPALRAACARAIEARVLLVAAVPARGAAVYPGAYPGVLRATGDARCAPDEISHLATAQADFGGCVRDAEPGSAGASIGCAHVAAALAAILAAQPGIDAAAAVAALARAARYVGPERRSR